MRIPAVKPRRQWDSRDRGALAAMKESDNDFVANNMRACVWFLENRDKLLAALKRESAPEGTLSNKPQPELPR
jgi:hypothetical protein